MRITICVKEVLDPDAVNNYAIAGRLEIGEASLAVAVASPHRQAAFEACQYSIDRIKQIVPIWKKEFFEGGEVWVGSQEDQLAKEAANSAGSRSA